MDRPVIVHRAVLGSVERMFAILTEHYAAKWPFWLNPRQVKQAEREAAAAAAEREAAVAAAEREAAVAAAEGEEGEEAAVAAVAAAEGEEGFLVTSSLS
jgi:threonyl-tRNA synthetase